MEGILVLLVMMFFYFLPTLIAVSSKKRNRLAIFMLNLLAGWTIIGWVGVFIWSLLKDD
jgi:hypothetical protein